MFKKYPKFGHAFIIEAITGWNKFGFDNKASANYVGILSKQSDYVNVYDMNCPSDRNYLTDLNKIRLQARFKSTSIISFIGATRIRPAPANFIIKSSISFSS